MKKIYLVYGGGKFGKIVYEKFHTTHQLLIVDNSAECEAAKLPIPKISDLNPFLSKNDQGTFKILENIKATGQSYFILGEIHAALFLIDSLSIDFLIPVAPIHLMKEIILAYVKRWFPSVTVSEDAVISIPSDLIPAELQVFSEKPDTMYLSYAKWEERCPDNCSGPPGYCRVHKRLKPITVTDLCLTAWPGPYTYIFESWQLVPGIGGIPFASVEKHFQRLERVLKDFFNSLEVSSQIIIIGTTCNCHGVISAVNLMKK